MKEMKNEPWSLDKQRTLEDLRLQEAGLKPEDLWVGEAGTCCRKVMKDDSAHFKEYILKDDVNQNVSVIKDQRKFLQIIYFYDYSENSFSAIRFMIAKMSFVML